MARETLTREQIVAAAIELLDADGIDGLTMRQLGRRLGSAATAVYWHVQSKEDLLALAADEIWGAIGLPGPATGGWREAVTSLVRGAYDAAGRHRWLMPALTRHYVYGPGMARWQDACYAALEAAGFSGAELDKAMGAISVLVIGAASAEASRAAMRARAGSGGGELAGPIRERIERAAEVAAMYPRLSARLAEQEAAGREDPEGESLEFGLRAALDGFEAYLEGRAAVS